MLEVWGIILVDTGDWSGEGRILVVWCYYSLTTTMASVLAPLT